MQALALEVEGARGKLCAGVVWFDGEDESGFYSSGKQQGRRA